jgi:hypothetical protein
MGRHLAPRACQDEVMPDERAALIEQVLALPPEALNLLWQPQSERDGLAHSLSQLSLADLRAVLGALQILCYATRLLDLRDELAAADD